jgi:hypothetical protein
MMNRGAVSLNGRLVHRLPIKRRGARRTKRLLYVELLLLLTIRETSHSEIGSDNPLFSTINDPRKNSSRRNRKISLFAIREQSALCGYLIWRGRVATQESD